MHSCYGCGKTTVRAELCNRCDTRYNMNKRQIRFLGKTITLSFNPRLYICSDCKSVCNTDLHHWFYVPCMPWTCIQEVCRSCHNNISWGTGQLKPHPRSGRLTSHDPKTGKFVSDGNRLIEDRL